MTTEQLSEGNKLIGDMDALGRLIDEYQESINKIANDVDDEIISIYHNKMNFSCTNKDLIFFISSLKEKAELKNESLFIKFKNL